MEHVWIGTGTEQTMRRRAHWVRRGVAVFVDSILVMLLVLPIGIITHPISGGRLQGGLGHETCRGLSSMPDGSALPAALRIGQIAECRDTFLGFEVGRRLEVKSSALVTFSTKHRRWTGLLGPDGQIVSGLPLFVLALPAYWIWRAWADSRRRSTLGRWMTGTEVVTDRNEPPYPGLALKRQLANGLPLALALPLGAWPYLVGTIVFTPAWLEPILTLLTIAIALPHILMTIRPMQKGQDTAFDCWLGTTVVMRE